MPTVYKTEVLKNLKEKTILIAREFDAPVDLVWRAFTEKELLDQWWGPSPWRAETRLMNFSVGGYWLYAMVGPENEKHWGRMNYLAINRHQSFDLEDGFCDENGTINAELPLTQGRNIFTKTNTGTKVELKSLYASEAAVQQIVEMGFEQGITVCFEQLDALLSTWKK